MDLVLHAVIPCWYVLHVGMAAAGTDSRLEPVAAGCAAGAGRILRCGSCLRSRAAAVVLYRVPCCAGPGSTTDHQCSAEPGEL